MVLSFASALVGAQALRLPPAAASLLGGVVCFALRMVAVWQHWQLPKAM